jgi:hypothetical protein
MNLDAIIRQAYAFIIVFDQSGNQLFLYDEVLRQAAQGKSDLYASLIIIAYEVQHGNILLPFILSKPAAQLLEEDPLLQREENSGMLERVEALFERSQDGFN